MNKSNTQIFFSFYLFIVFFYCDIPAQACSWKAVATILVGSSFVCANNLQNNELSSFTVEEKSKKITSFAEGNYWVSSDRTSTFLSNWEENEKIVFHPREEEKKKASQLYTTSLFLTQLIGVGGFVYVFAKSLVDHSSRKVKRIVDSLIERIEKSAESLVFSTSERFQYLGNSFIEHTANTSYSLIDHASSKAEDLTKYTVNNICFWKNSSNYSENSKENTIFIKKERGLNKKNQASNRLHLSALKNSQEAVDFNKADDTEFTTLHLSSKCNNIEAANTLINDGADVNQSDKNGWTPLHYAVANKSEKVADLLIKRNSDMNKVNHDGETPLYLAIRLKIPSMAVLLIEKGAKLNMEGGLTPLHYAAKYNSEKVAKILIQRTVSSFNSKQQFNRIAWSNNQEALQMVKDKKEAFLNAVDQDGRTALHYAAKYNSQKIVRLLISEGVNLNKTDFSYFFFGKTALQYAKESKSIEVTKLLTDAQSLSCLGKYHRKLIVLLFHVWEVGPTGIMCSIYKTIGNFIVRVYSKKGIKYHNNLVDRSKKSLNPWRVMCKGLNLEGCCVNRSCEAYTKKVWVQKGFGTFSLEEEVCESECPICKKEVEEITECGFYYCKYRIKGCKLNKEKIDIKDTHNSKDGFRKFESDGGNSTQYRYLKIIVTRHEQ